MSQIKVIKDVNGIRDLCVIDLTIHRDSRGYFMETYNYNDMKENGMDMVFVQDNQSLSTKGTLRGMHYQKKFPQGKLVRVVHGAVYDVVIDLRRDSETFGKWYGVELTDENKRQFYIPPGFAHGFYVLSDVAELCYKCTDFYHPGDEGGIIWDDPDIGIEWPLIEGVEIIMSDKDKRQQSFAEYRNAMDKNTEAGIY